jgi:hypothetical protein
VLLPVHPLNRLQGLRPGQTWTVPGLDPLVSFPLGSMRVVELRARVLDEPAIVHWKNRDWHCWVVEYKGDGQEARTWVEREGGLVLRQETVFGGERWLLQRQ